MKEYIVKFVDLSMTIISATSESMARTKAKLDYPGKEIESCRRVMYCR